MRIRATSANKKKYMMPVEQQILFLRATQYIRVVMAKKELRTQCSKVYEQGSTVSASDAYNSRRPTTHYNVHAKTIACASLVLLHLGYEGRQKNNRLWTALETMLRKVSGGQSQAVERHLLIQWCMALAHVHQIFVIKMHTHGDRPQGYQHCNSSDLHMSGV
jgi:hypothetical protein